VTGLGGLIAKIGVSFIALGDAACAQITIPIRLGVDADDLAGFAP
jgi:hypothetical protein